MQQIILSGTLLTDPERCKDKNGKYYTRFTLTCGSNDMFGRTVFTHYRCTCYIGGYERLRKGDQVFLSGKFSPSSSLDRDGKSVITSLNVMVYQISGGYRAQERTEK